MPYEVLDDGFFKRRNDAPEQEKSVNDNLYFLYNGIVGSVNVLPNGIEQPADVRFWKGPHLEYVKQQLAALKELAGQQNLTEFTNPYTNEKINIGEFVTKTENSIAFSEHVAPQLLTQPALSEEESAKRRAAIKKRLMGE